MASVRATELMKLPLGCNTLPRVGPKNNDFQPYGRSKIKIKIKSLNA